MKNYIEDFNQIFIDNSDTTAYERIIDNLDDCSEFLFNVAFITFGGIQLFLNKLKNLEQKGIKGKILTTNYLDSTEVDAVKKLLEFKNIEIRIFDASNISTGLHAKTYLFKKEKTTKVIIGSSNITTKGLRINHEWNMEMIYENNSEVLVEIESIFWKLWYDSKDFDENLFKIEDQYKLLNTSKSEDKVFIKNKMQKIALLNLEKIRKKGETKAIAVAATGTGKTYLSAFDVKNFNCKRILFICHRREILEISKNTFRNVFKNPIFSNFKNIYDFSSDDKIFCFETIQTLYSNENFKKVKKDFFDYIILDEAHHSASESYQLVFDYFTPKFLLGLTATPDRFDGRDIYEKFDNNIVMNIRLREALNEDLLCPFNYFGVSDLQTIDLSKVDISKVNTYEKKLMIKERVDLIVEKLKFYSNPYKKIKCLAFCASTNHAKYMEQEFNKLGIKSVCLLGEDKHEQRLDQIEKLKNGEIEVIFCRDIFNEGIDIPEINTILMLRPTESPTIFIQQLGRGLRKFFGKEAVTIIDFIGNHKNLYNLAFSFGADYLYDKEAIKEYIKNDFKDFSRFAFFQIDKIAKNEILKNIEEINFNSFKWLVKKYNNFKSSFSNKNKVPMWLDYFTLDESPDIVKFIKNYENKDKSYYGFLVKIGEIKNELSDHEKKILRTLESFLPLKRNYEYIILQTILKNRFFDIKNFDKNIFVNFKQASYESAISDLNLNFTDKKSFENFSHIIKSENNLMSFSYSLNNLIKKDFFKKYIEELLTYGLNEYYFRTGEKNINKLKLFEKYSRDEILKLFNWKGKYSSWREGVKLIDNDFIMVVNLDKSEMNKDSIKYKDHFINKKMFVWESQNNTSIKSEIGQKIINHKIKNINLHLFVRKSKKENSNEPAPYYYLGLVDVLSYEKEKPIKFTFQLKEFVDDKVYKDLCN